MSLYDEVVSLGKPYLGMVTDQFMARQCKFHLKIRPQELSESHLEELARWVEISAGLIMDKEKAKELKDRIVSLRRIAA